MKTVLKNFWNNLDLDQRQILKSVIGISAFVLALSFIFSIYMSFLAIPLEMIVTRLMSNKDIKKTKKYILDKKANKKFKPTLPLRFVQWWVILATVSWLIIQMIDEHLKAITPFVVLMPFVITRLSACFLKLPMSVLLLSTGPDDLHSAISMHNANVNHHQQLAFSDTVNSSTKWWDESANAVLTNPAFSSLPSNMYHRQYHKTD